jgi:glycosyltransferase involved in cell wall biosynthesis
MNQVSNYDTSEISLSVVVIGLDEEARIGEALASAIDECPPGVSLEVYYVDSGSSDRSVEIANSVQGVVIMHLGAQRPSAAKARNAGLRRAKAKYVQLLDGDSIIQPGWLRCALDYLEANPGVACVFGQCLEMNPKQSIYMRVCGLDWHIPPGDHRLCGGNAMWRREVLEHAGFFDESLQLGEEPDLCRRVREVGWRIRCIDRPMVRHDLGMVSFRQYWQRGVNSGKSYVRVAMRYWKSEEKLWLYEVVRNFLEPFIWIGLLVFGAWFFGWMVGGAALVCWWSLRAVRTAIKVRARVADWGDAFLYGVHTQFIRLPVALGQFNALASAR